MQDFTSCTVTYRLAVHLEAGTLGVAHHPLQPPRHLALLKTGRVAVHVVTAAAACLSAGLPGCKEAEAEEGDCQSHGDCSSVVIGDVLKACG